MNRLDEEKLAHSGFSAIAIKKLKLDLDGGREIYWPNSKNQTYVIVSTGSAIATCDRHGRYTWLDEFKSE